MMAVDHDFLSVRPFTRMSYSSTSSSYRAAFQSRIRLIQVATDNSATFIRFPSHHRQPVIFTPICPSRTSYSSTPVSSITTTTDNSFSKSYTTDHSDYKRDSIPVHFNPILNNPLLNHRREPKPLPIKSSENLIARSTRLCLSTKPLKNNAFNPIISTNRASTIPPVTTIPPVEKIDDDNGADEHHPEEDLSSSFLDDNKHDYISRWINEVRAATFTSDPVCQRPRRTRRRFTQT